VLVLTFSIIAFVSFVAEGLLVDKGSDALRDFFFGGDEEAMGTKSSSLFSCTGHVACSFVIVGIPCGRDGRL